jgi:hypothetical protein
MRHVFRRRVLQAVPSTVVLAADGTVVTWIAPQTPIAYPSGLDGAGRLRPLAEWSVEPRPWFGPGALDVTPLGRAHMIRHFWHDDGTFRGWYVNLQAPVRRVPGGLDSMDHQLDLWVDADGSVSWKDEDHLAQAVEQGMLTAEDAAAVRAEGEHVVAEWPFPTGWEKWRPDPAWPVPELPSGWDIV